MRSQATARASKAGFESWRLRVASCPSSAALESEAQENELDVVGLIAFRDPLRAAARDAVHMARAAGIAVRMLTGDHAATARAIASELGIPAEWVARASLPRTSCASSSACRPRVTSSR